MAHDTTTVGSVTCQVWIAPFHFGKVRVDRQVSLVAGRNMLHWLADRGGDRGIWA